MKSRSLRLAGKHRAFIDRFSAACRQDDRVLAAFLGGSYAKGTSDAHSDLDLTLITTDAAYPSFVAEREVFARRLGEPLFLEDFDRPDIVFLIFSDGVEAEIHFASPNHLEHLHSGLFHTLIDKAGILDRAEFPPSEADPAEQREKLRRLIYGFWHEWSHFTTAMGRGQLWWARGQLDALRGICVNLVRLERNFSDEGVGAEPYFKLEDEVSPQNLSGLQATFCPVEQEPIAQSARLVLRFYQEVAPRLARTHGLRYPAELERILTNRLNEAVAALAQKER